MKMLLVPQGDIDSLEIARKDLWGIINNIKDERLKEALTIRILNVTQPMWRIANRRYKQPLTNRIYSKIFKSN